MLELLANLPADGFSLKEYIDLGVIVVVLAAIMTRKLVPGWVYEAEKTAREKAELTVQQLRDKIEDDVLPQLYLTTQVVAEFMEKRTAK